MKFSVKGALIATFATAIMVSAMTGCSSTQSSDPAIGEVINKALMASERSGVASVELSRVEVGDWSKVMIVCRGNTQAQIVNGLGFQWAGPKVSSPGFLAMLVFFNRTRVVGYFSAGQDLESVDHWYFTPCSLTKRPISEPPIVLSRANSNVKFTFDKSLGSPHLYFWYVQDAELAALRAQ